MVSVIPIHQVTLGQLKQIFELQFVQDSSFFSEWLTANLSLPDKEKHQLDRVKNNFLSLLDYPPLLENSVTMVVLAPLLDLADFYHYPFRIETEPSVEIDMKDEDVVIQGRIDILVIKNRLWLLVIESKRSDFSVIRAIPQALAYMLANPTPEQPTFGMITNGNEFLFLKAISSSISRASYGNSRLFSLVNPDNELYSVLQILKCLGALSC